MSLDGALALGTASDLCHDAVSLLVERVVRAKLFLLDERFKFCPTPLTALIKQFINQSELPRILLPSV